MEIYMEMTTRIVVFAVGVMLLFLKTLARMMFPEQTGHYHKSELGKYPTDMDRVIVVVAHAHRDK